jgi:hypothetical protein
MNAQDVHTITDLVRSIVRANPSVQDRGGTFHAHSQHESKPAGITINIYLHAATKRQGNPKHSPSV